MKRKKDGWKTAGGYFLSLAVFVLVLALFGAGTVLFAKRAEENGAETLRSSIGRASVQCYAIEGRYPPSIKYLEENYGLQIDQERYNVFYSGFASNIMPDITVVEIPKEERRDRNEEQYP